MPILNFERILSVSSEDPANPAENLLKLDNNKKWKCKAGEKQASVILQLKHDTIIEGIDVGNANSAFIEVLVGKTSSPSTDFKVLLVASSLMSLKEAKDGTNANGVRFFKRPDLTKPTADEKWDKVKIVCTQPFNRHVQFGLSFVVLHSPNQENNSESSGNLGRFVLKEEDEEETPVSVGSWFAKRKDPPPVVPTGAAASIRDALSPVAIALNKNKKPTPKRPRKTPTTNGCGNLKTKNGDTSDHIATPASTNKPKKPRPNENLSYEDDKSSTTDDDTDADATYSPNKDPASVLSDDDDIPDDSQEETEGNRKKKLTKKRKDPTQKNTYGGSTLKRQIPKRKNFETDNSTAKMMKIDSKKRKPFGQILEGVTIVISGYQNPLRGELRTKACAMGARYKADWDATCTHLVCAFVNTPKFSQVRGRGKIVKKDWVEECHNLRRRLPWRRFALDRNDIGTSSEEEVWEEQAVPTTSSVNSTIASGINRRKVSSGSDTEEEIERVKAKQAEDQQKLSTLKQLAPKKTPQESDTFADDTDVDSESDSPAAKLPLPSLPDFFDNIVFHIAGDIQIELRRQLQRYITAYKGCTADEVDGSVEYVITNLPEVAAEVGEEFGIAAVSPEWIWQCSDAEKRIPIDDYLL